MKPLQNVKRSISESREYVEDNQEWRGLLRQLAKDFRCDSVEIIGKFKYRDSPTIQYQLDFDRKGMNLQKLIGISAEWYDRTYHIELVSSDANGQLIRLMEYDYPRKITDRGTEIYVTSILIGNLNPLKAFVNSGFAIGVQINKLGEVANSL